MTTKNNEEKPCREHTRSCIEVEHMLPRVDLRIRIDLKNSISSEEDGSNNDRSGGGTLHEIH